MVHFPDLFAEIFLLSVRLFLFFLMVLYIHRNSVASYSSQSPLPLVFAHKHFAEFTEDADDLTLTVAI